MQEYGKNVCLKPVPQCLQELFKALGRCERRVGNPPAHRRAIALGRDMY